MSEPKRVVFLAGLPRSGSTLLCNVLGMHPQVRATATSPLCDLVQTLRLTWSSSEALLAELERDREGVYERLLRSTRAFIEAWSGDAPTPVTVDKSRFWLFHVETVRELYPDFKMIVCLRDLRDVYASIEKQHRKTMMLALPGSAEASLVDARAMALFEPSGVVGGPLRALYNLGDMGDLSENLFFWHFERFLDAPEEVTERLLAWLGVEPTRLDLSRIEVSTAEADAFYRLKFLHDVKPTIEKPRGFQEADVSPRIVAAIVERFGWYYRMFYGKDGVSLGSDDTSQALRVNPARFASS